MNTKQKFKKGNLVEVLVGHQMWSSKDGDFDSSPEDVGRKAIIEYSYDDRYGGGDVDSYSIIWMDTGSSLAWKRTHELKLINKGGDHLFKEAELNKEKLSNRDKDMAYISSILDKGSLSSESILFLFDLLGFETSFYKNGEFYAIYSEWATLHCFFVHIKRSKTLDEAISGFPEEWQKKFNIEIVYNSFKAVA